MKRQDSIIGSSLSRGFSGALIGTIIAMAPFAAQAHGGGGGGGGGHGGGGGGGFGHGGGGGFAHGGGGFASGGGGFAHSGGAPAHMGVAGGGVMSRSSIGFGGSTIGSARNETAFARNAAPISHAMQGPAPARQPVRDSRMNQPSHERISRQFDQLARRSDHRGDSRFRRGRLFRTRDFLIGLVDFGWPVDLIDTWSDAITQDEILAGMPSDLVLDYWGNPLSVDAVALPGGPAQIWTYRSRPAGTLKVTVAGNRVAAVRRG